jgi:hypothetical protein
VLNAAAGMPNPRAPKPLSKYMQLFLVAVAAKVGAMGVLFRPDELKRLKKIAPAFVKRLELNDSDLIEEIYKLLCMHPEDAVEWIRERFAEIEARFAS